MRKIIVLLFLVLNTLVSTLTWAQQPYKGFKLVFSDEFEQTNYSFPDTTKWNWHSRYPGIWSRWISSSSEVVFIKDSMLVCRAVPNINLLADTARMLTGAINTKGKFSFKYGRIDVRMKTNLIQGNFPAVWMRPANNKDSRYGEIDIVEMFGNQKKAFHAIHSHRTYTLQKKDIPSSYNEDVNVAEWHVYSVEWSKKKVIWLVDGVVVGEYKKKRNRKMKKEGQWTFDRPFYIILNQSVGDNSRPFFRVDTNAVYETNFDWIRVYQKK